MEAHVQGWFTNRAAVKNTWCGVQIFLNALMILYSLNLALCLKIAARFITSGKEIGWDSYPLQSEW